MQQEREVEPGDIDRDTQVLKEIGRLGDRPIEILELLIQNSENGLTAEETKKKGVNISKQTISGYLSKLRTKKLVKSVEEQNGNNQWTVRYFPLKKVISAIKNFILGVIAENPGILTTEIENVSPFSFSFITSMLIDLGKEGLINSVVVEDQGKLTEKWNTTVQDA